MKGRPHIVYLANRTGVAFDVLSSVIELASTAALGKARPYVHVTVSWSKGTYGKAKLLRVEGRKRFGARIRLGLRRGGYMNWSAHELALSFYGTAVHEFHHALEYYKGIDAPRKTGRQNRKLLRWNDRPWEKRAMIAQAVAIEDVIMGRDRAARRSVDALAKELTRLGVVWA